jgi:hypothetical protein
METAILEIRDAYRNLDEKHEMKRPLGRPTQMGE